MIINGPPVAADLGRMGLTVDVILGHKIDQVSTGHKFHNHIKIFCILK